MKIEEQIKAWKKEGHIVLHLPLEDGRDVYFSQADRKKYKLIMSQRQAGTVGMASSFVTNCYLGGDVPKEMFYDKKETEYIGYVIANMDDLLQMKKVEIKKL